MTGELISLWDATWPMVFNQDLLLMGLGLIALLILGGFALKIKSGGIALMLAGVVYLLSIFEPIFKPVFILLIVLAILSIVNGVKNSSR